MRLLATIALLFLISAPATAPAAEPVPRLNNYKGADAGYLVFSVAHTGQLGTYEIRRLDAQGEAKISHKVHQGFSPKLPMGDFWKELPAPPQPDELKDTKFFFKPVKASGDIVLTPLPPGRYELYSVTAGASFGTLGVLKDEFATSIPFTISTGRAAYIGEFDYIYFFSRPLGYDLEGVVALGHSDEFQRDLALAEKENPAITKATADLFVPPDLVAPGRLKIAKWR